VKQNKKAKICFVIYIPGFFFLNFFCYEVIVKQKNYKRASNYYCGDDIFSDLPCSCPICAVTKSETPGHRKFERHFQHADIDVTKVQGDYLIAHDP